MIFSCTNIIIAVAFLAGNLRKGHAENEKQTVGDTRQYPLAKLGNTSCSGTCSFHLFTLGPFQVILFCICMKNFSLVPVFQFYFLASDHLGRNSWFEIQSLISLCNISPFCREKFPYFKKMSQDFVSYLSITTLSITTFFSSFQEITSC